MLRRGAVFVRMLWRAAPRIANTPPQSRSSEVTGARETQGDRLGRTFPVKVTVTANPAGVRERLLKAPSASSTAATAAGGSLEAQQVEVKAAA
jgi:hypothetical protein